MDIESGTIEIKDDTVSIQLKLKPDLPDPPPEPDCLIVKPGDPDAFQTITDAFADVQDGECIKIYPHPSGTYVAHGNTEPARIRLIGKKNVRVIGVDQPVIDGNHERGAALRKYGAVTISNCEDCLIEGLVIREAFFAGVITNPRSTNITFKNCSFIGCMMNGAVVEGSDGIHFEKCVSLDNKRVGTSRAAGFAVSSGATNISFLVCEAAENEGDGYRFGMASDIHVENCLALRNQRQGLLTSGTSFLTVRGGVYSLNGSTGIQIEAVPPRIPNGRHVLIRGAEVANNSHASPGECGIWIDDTDDCVVEYCNVHENLTGIRVGSDSGSRNCIVRFNLVYDNNGSQPGNNNGVDFNKSQNLAIYHNTIWGNGHQANSNNRAAISSNGDNESVAVVNNIIGAQSPNRNNSSGLIHWTEREEIAKSTANLYWQEPKERSWSIGSSEMTFQGYLAAVGEASQHADPNLNASLEPLPNSPAIGTAERLSVVLRVHENKLSVQHPFLFAVGDTILVGNRRCVVNEVLSDGIAIDRTTAQAGDPISMHDNIGAK